MSLFSMKEELNFNTLFAARQYTRHECIEIALVLQVPITVKQCTLVFQ